MSQARLELEPDANKTVYDAVSEGDDVTVIDGRDISTRAFCSSFNLKGEAQQKLVKSLSGGEKNRTYMAKMLRRGYNFLLLDEPTNDLDVETLRSLEEAMQMFDGTSIIISHDRWFLDRVCTHILAFEGNGEVTFFTGDYSEYVKDLSKRKGTNVEEQIGQGKAHFVPLKL